MRNLSANWRSRVSFVCTIACLSLAATRVADAHYFCVTTTQELQDALTQSSDGGANAGEDNTIDIAQGIYKTGAVTGHGPFQFSSTAATGGIYIYGGYLPPDCSQPAMLTPFSTVLDGNSQTQVMSVVNPFGSGVTVESLTFQNGSTNIKGSGLFVSSGGDVEASYNVIQNNHTTDQGGGLVVEASGTGTVRMSDNLVVGNSADGGSGAGYATTGTSTSVWLINNTMYNNTTTLADGIGGFECCGSSTANPVVSANIFWKNTTEGIDLHFVPAILQYNDYGTLGGTAPANPGYASINLSTEPLFKDRDNGDFHLTGQSPLMGYTPAGGYCDQTRDIEGHPRAYYSPCDSGAFEETIFANGLEGN